MSNEYYGAASTPTSDFLAHYGVKGMKWGVRKAIASGNSRRLGRQYAKAQKKLAKLEKRAASGKKYARRAAALGAGAAAAGGLAAVGTRGVGIGLNAAGDALRTLGRTPGKGSGVKRHATSAGLALNRAGEAVTTWGAGSGVGKLAKRGANAALQATPNNLTRAANKALKSGGHAGIGSQINKLDTISNSGYARLAGAAVGAGLGAGAAYNAYRAATTKKAARKAAEFRREMNKAFAGTKYANSGRSSSGKKRRRSNRG